MAVLSNNPVQPRRFTPSHVSVEAMQLDGSSVAVAQWLAGYNVSYAFETHAFDSTRDRLTLMTPKGHHEVRPGDWVIRGVTGLFFTMSDHEFRATYTEVAA